MPNSERNARLKFETSPKPLSSAMSSTLPDSAASRMAASREHEDSPHVLMWRKSREAFKRPQEVVRAEAALSRQLSQRQRRVGMYLSFEPSGLHALLHSA